MKLREKLDGLLVKAQAKAAAEARHIAAQAEATRIAQEKIFTAWAKKRLAEFIGELEHAAERGEHCHSAVITKSHANSDIAKELFDDYFANENVYYFSNWRHVRTYGEAAELELVVGVSWRPGPQNTTDRWKLKCGLVIDSGS